MILATIISLNTMESLQNGLQPYSGGTPLFSSVCCFHSVDTGAQCKLLLTENVEEHECTIPVSIDAVQTGTVYTGARRALVDVDVTSAGSPARLTRAAVARHVVATRAVVVARVRLTLVDVDLTPHTWLFEKQLGTNSISKNVQFKEYGCLLLAISQEIM